MPEKSNFVVTQRERPKTLGTKNSPGLENRARVTGTQPVRTPPVWNPKGLPRAGAFFRGIQASVGRKPPILVSGNLDSFPGGKFKGFRTPKAPAKLGLVGTDRFQGKSPFPDLPCFSNRQTGPIFPGFSVMGSRMNPVFPRFSRLRGLPG